MKKSGPYTHGDNRSLVLKEGRKSTKSGGKNVFDYVVITGKGPKKIIMEKAAFENHFLNPTRDLSKGKLWDPDSNPVLSPADSKRPFVRLFDLSKEKDEGLLEEAVRRSIETETVQPPASQGPAVPPPTSPNV